MKIEPQMADLPAEKQAARAIIHTLSRISESAPVAWFCGYGTQTYALLTEAHATLHGITIDEARENWPPAKQPKFDDDMLRRCPFCGGCYLHVVEAVVGFNVECRDCDIQGPNGDTESDARNAWNERQYV